MGTSLKGKVALVAGATRGAGRGIAVQLGAAGATWRRSPPRILRLGMGTFHTHCQIENPTKRTKRASIPEVLVDTASEFTWVPASVLERLDIRREKKDVRFVMANGQEITRSRGFAIIHEGFFTIDEVVFGEPGDLALLGGRTLEGLNLQVDSQRKQLVASGPFPAAPNPSPRSARRTKPTRSR
jgi:predicted aspartyl protease